MCGRYVVDISADLLVDEFDVAELGEGAAEATEPRFNVAPTDLVPAVLDRGETRKLMGLRWGLVPSWSKDASGAARMINARAETVAEKPAFRKAFASRRCVLPAAGYYEWRPEPDGGKQVKQPWFIRPADDSLMVMAGIYEFWKGPDGWLATASIITTSAADGMGWVHDRMPVQVRRDSLDAWLDPDLTSPDAARALWHVPTADELRVYAVSRAVNGVRNDGPDLMAPLLAN